MPFGSIADAKVHKKNGLETLFLHYLGTLDDNNFTFN